MTEIPYIFSNKSLTFIVDGQPYQISKESVNYHALLDELADCEPDPDVLIALSKPVVAIKTIVDRLAPGVVDVSLNGVCYNGDPVHGALVDRMMEILSSGLSITPWIKFMENLYQNPSDISRDELYLWLETSGMPITSDGHFLAYKRVRDTYYDIYSNSVFNGVGEVVSMARAEVDTDRHNTCSRGLHFCSKEYLPHFGTSERGSDRVLVVKINPADVVSIPSDYNNAKGRTWQYQVVGEIEPDEVTRGYAWKPVESGYGQYSWDDSDYDDEAEDEDWSDDDQDALDRYDELTALGIRELRKKASDIAKANNIPTVSIWKRFDKDALITFILENE